MAKSKLSEKYSLSVEGILDIRDGDIVVEVDDIGEKNLAGLLAKFNGSNVKISVSFGNELE